MLLLNIPAEVAQAPQPPPTPQTPSTGEAAPAAKTSMRPLKQVSLETLRAAVRAQEGPHTAALIQAWAYYKKFQGSWRPDAKKPSPEDLAAFDAFKGELEKRPLPEWFEQARQQPGKGVSISLNFDPSSPGFSQFRQTEATESIKALALVYLTEHELDRKGAADKGATTLTVLISHTYFDHELHALFARFLVDAKVPTNAMEEARLSIYLNPAPTRHDLEFAAFVILHGAGKGGWGPLQAILREAASKPEDAEAVIQEWGPKVQKGDLKFINLPGPK